MPPDANSGFLNVLGAVRIVRGKNENLLLQQSVDPSANHSIAVPYAALKAINCGEAASPSGERAEVALLKARQHLMAGQRYLDVLSASCRNPPSIAAHAEVFVEFGCGNFGSVEELVDLGEACCVARAERKNNALQWDPYLEVEKEHTTLNCLAVRTKLS